MADLSTLRDIHTPIDPPLWPLAIGWWLLAVSIIVVIALLPTLRRSVQSFIQRQRVLHQFRRIHREAKRASDDATITRALADLSQLVRQVAHARLRPEYHAQLTGEAWLMFLTRTGDGTDFCDTPGRYLADAPYQPASRPIEFNVPQLMVQVKHWLKRHA